MQVILTGNIQFSCNYKVTLQTGFMLWQNRNMSWDLCQNRSCVVATLHIIQCHYTPTSCKVKMHILQYTPG